MKKVSVDGIIILAFTVLLGLSHFSIYKKICYQNNLKAVTTNISTQLKCYDSEKQSGI